MKKSIAAGLFIAVLIFILSAVVSVRKIADQRTLNEERTHAFGIEQKLESVVDGIMRAETAYGNFMQTGDPRYLEAYRAAVAGTLAIRDKLARIYSGGHASGRFDELSLLITSRIDVLRELVRAVRRNAPPRAQVEILNREEKIHNELLSAVQDLERGEADEIAVLDARIGMLSRQSIYSLLAGAFLSVLIFSGLFYLLYRELQERRRLEQLVKRQAHTDLLTGLPNLRAFMERLGYELTQASRDRQRLAVMFLDLDRFKDVNDSLGHEAGDRLLQEVAARLRLNVRESDTVARIAGDEFNVLLTNISDTASITRVAEKVIEALRLPFTVRGQEIQSGASIGISIYPEDGQNAGVLVKNADLAMYHAKEQGRNNFKFYNANLNSRLQERVLMESYLRHTLEKKELMLHYQPQIDVRTKRIVCAETLVRWKHPERGILGPLDFIPLAEGIGFITSLDEWVIRTACTEMRAVVNTGGPGCLTVNISEREFRRPDLASVVAGILAETSFDPDRFGLELSEQAAMADTADTAVKFHELREVGVRTVIDHFGAGFSSLSDLKKLPVEKIKISRFFIREIESSRNDRAIVKAIIGMAHDMGITIVAEGVETREQLEFLEENGCDEVQGYHLCGPVPFGDLTAFAASFQALRS